MVTSRIFSCTTAASDRNSSNRFVSSDECCHLSLVTAILRVACYSCSGPHQCQIPVSLHRPHYLHSTITPFSHPSILPPFLFPSSPDFHSSFTHPNFQSFLLSCSLSLVWYSDRLGEQRWIELGAWLGWVRSLGGGLGSGMG